VQKQHLILISTCLVFLLLQACNTKPNHPWTKTIPADIPALITVEESTQLSQIVDKPYIPILDDISASAIPVIQEVDNIPNHPITVKAILMTPTTSREWQPVWVTKADMETLPALSKKFRQDFTQNYYDFNSYRVEKLFVGNRIIYATQVGKWLLLSESSFAVEESIRSYGGHKKSLKLSENPPSPKLIVNPPHLEDWVKQLAKVGYLPALNNLFEGMEPAIVTVNSNDDPDQSLKHHFSGKVPLQQEGKSSVLTNALSHSNAPLELDRYISDNAASFAIFRLDPVAIPPENITDPTPVDSLLLADEQLYQSFVNTLDSEFAFVSYAESGYLSEGEHLYLRHLKDFRAFYSLLKQLEQGGYIEQIDNVFYVRSQVLGRLIGSPLNTLNEFFVTNAYKAAVIAQRKGRATSVKSDRSRRRVIYYEENYLSIRETFPDSLSGLVVSNSNKFLEYLQPYLAPNNYLSSLFSRFNFLTMTFRVSPDRNSLATDIKTYNLNQSDLPYEEQWVFPLDNQQLSGKPVLADIGGSSRDEVIFASTGGKVFALATDGTVVMQANTGQDTPIGSPIVYDWYGNNQDAILQAANNKIYAWNDIGQPLPQFPLTLDEQISAPPVVADVTRDGIPELIVATRDRKLHVLNGRGKNIDGWPQTLNAPVTEEPIFKRVGGEWSIWALSSNTLYSWRPDGNSRTGFPKFINASFNGSPYFYEDHLLANAADGHLYTVGTKPLFPDSLDVMQNSDSRREEGADSLVTQALYVSNSALTGTPSVRNVTMLNRDSTTTSEPRILTMSANGSVFLLDISGQLQFTKSMGQPSATGFNPFWANIDNNNRPDLLALANFGRLYSWDVYSNKRLYSLPTTGMQYPLITDFENDDRPELIAQTREGLRCWTLQRTRN